MQIEDLLKISSEIRDAIRTYITETEDYGEVILQRAQDVTRRIDMFAEKALERKRNRIH